MTYQLLVAVLLMLMVPSSVKAEGCMLSAAPSGLPSGSQRIRATGIAALDKWLVAEAWRLAGEFEVLPDFFLIDDSQSPNAWATPEITESRGPDGTVMYGVNFMRMEFQRGGIQGFGVLAIMAHEFAHIAQFKNDLTPQGKGAELMADYLAGWYLARRSSEIATNLYISAKTFYGIGDYGFNSPGHHGTPGERLAAFRAGVETRHSSREEALKSGYMMFGGSTRSATTSSAQVNMGGQSRLTSNWDGIYEPMGGDRKIIELNIFVEDDRNTIHVVVINSWKTSRGQPIHSQYNGSLKYQENQTSTANQNKRGIYKGRLACGVSILNPRQGDKPWRWRGEYVPFQRSPYCQDEDERERVMTLRVPGRIEKELIEEDYGPGNYLDIFWDGTAAFTYRHVPNTSSRPIPMLEFRD